MTRRPALILLGVVALGVIAWWGAPTPFWRGVIVGVFAVLVVALVGLSYGARRMRSRASAAMEAPPIPSEAEPWDYTMSANDLGGSPIDFARHRGRVLILNRWATWCAPCIAEMPSLRRLHRETVGSGVDLVCVTTEEASKVDAFLTTRELDVPIAIAAEPLPARFESRGLPTTFVIDARGHVVFRHVGAARWDDAKVVDYVRGVAGQDPRTMGV